MKTTTIIKTGELTAERRAFIKKTGSLAVLSMFGVAFFTGCSSDDPNPGTGGTTPPVSGNGITVTASTVTINLDLATALAVEGGWALVIAAKVLVVNLGGNTFSALTSVCTHSQCDRNWTYGSNVFTCTCHGSRFNPAGAVLTGPAIQPLRSYPTNLNNRTLTIDLT